MNTDIHLFTFLRFFAVISITFTSSFAQISATSTGQSKSNKLTPPIVIKYGWDVPIVTRLSHPEFVQEINNSPYDGLVFNARKASWSFTGEEILLGTFEKELSQLKKTKFSRPMQNFLVMHVNEVKGGFGGPNHKTFVENMRRLGKAAGKSNLAGIVFDNEVYRRDCWKWTDDPNGNARGLSRKEYGQEAYKAGYEMMQAILEGWPDVKVISFFGIWLHDPEAWKEIKKFARANDWSNPNKVTGEFLAGMFSAIHETKAEFIDGGEIYGILKSENFKKAAKYLRHELPKTSPFLPDELRKGYEKEVKIAFGLYDFRDGIFGIPPRTPEQWANTIKAAQPHADYIWLYTEIHDWWLKDGYDHPRKDTRPTTVGPVTKEWLDEIGRAHV